MKKIILATAAAVALSGASYAGSHSVETVCEDGAVTWIIPFGEGGGSGKWARFWQPLLQPELPGDVSVTIEYMSGAGSTKGANFFQNEAEPDGCTILGTSGSTQFPYLLGDPRVEYEYEDWNIVLATPTGGVAYTTAELADKLDSTTLVYGSQGATSLDLVPLLAFELMGYKVEPIFGLKGRSAGRAAFLAGETNVDYQTSSAYLANIVPVVEAGDAVPLFSWGAVGDNGELVRDPTFPDIPHFSEVLAEKNPDAMNTPGYAAWKAFFTAGFAAQKMVFLPEGTDEGIVQAYRDAFEKASMADNFADISAARLGKYPQGFQGKAEVLKSQALSVDEESLDWVKNWLKESFDVEL